MFRAARAIPTMRLPPGYGKSVANHSSKTGRLQSAIGWRWRAKGKLTSSKKKRSLCREPSAVLALGEIRPPPPTKAVHAVRWIFSYLYRLRSRRAQCVSDVTENLDDRQQADSRPHGRPCARGGTNHNPASRSGSAKKSGARALRDLFPFTWSCCGTG